MAGPRSKRKRAEAPSETTAPNKQGRLPTGTESATEPRTDDDATTVAAAKNATMDESVIQIDAKTAAKTQQERPNDSNNDAGNDHAEPDTKNISLEGQNLADHNADPATTTNNSDTTDDSNNAKEDIQMEPELRQATVREILEHRKILLNRLRLGKVAAQKRLEMNLEREPLKKQETDEQEINAFREMSRIATSLARKQARTDEAALNEQKRPALRRGGTVGKKMNAALSSLAPGSTLAASEHVPVSQPASIMPPILSAAAAAGVSIPAVSSSSSAILSAEHLKSTNTSGRPSVPKKEKIPQPMPPLPNRAGGVQKLAKAPPPRMPLGSQPLSPSRPSVVCPETMSLRDRRKLLEAKLSSILSIRYQRIQLECNRSKRPLDASPASPVSYPTKAADIPSKFLESALKGPAEPVHLPSRRRTHWDSVLDEMKWLATDFMEERKWKTAATRALGESCQLRRPKSKVQREYYSSAQVSEDGQSSTEMEVENVEKEVQFSSEAKASSTNINVESFPCDVYSEVTDLDNSKAHNVAKILSSMILELSTATLSEGVSADLCDDYMKALRRHLLSRGQIEGKDLLPSKNGGDGKRGLNKAHSQDDSECSMIDGESGSQGPEDRDTIIQRMSKHVAEVLSGIEGAVELSKRSCKPEGIPVDLSQPQIRAVETMEAYWQRVKVGVQLSGPKSSGKTMAVSSLLYKNHLSGPQLIICYSSSMIRWMHEIGRFKDLHVHSVGLSPGISSPLAADIFGQLIDFTSGDIVVCEYASVDTLSKETFARFCSIVVDLRFPKGFYGSRLPVSLEINSEGSAGVVDVEPPVELTSVQWWSRLANKLSKRNPVNRLLLDNAPPSRSYDVFTSLNKRELLEILALRFAFVFSLADSQFPGHTLEKSILLWARRRIKDTKESLSKFERVRKLLNETLEKVSYSIEKSILLDDSGFVSPNWDIRLCRMTDVQRTAYEKCSHDCRPALSSKLESPESGPYSLTDSYFPVADALLRLRRVCLHDDCSGVLSEAMVCDGQPGDFDGLTHKSIGCGPSQPNIDLAVRLLDGSTKLQELLSVLMEDCGLDLIHHHSLEQFLRVEKESKKVQKRTERRRVAILATLPEAQILVSVLLNALCIQHELLLRPDAKTWSAAVGTVQTMMWAYSQIILSKFNGESSQASTDATYPMIIVGSPETVAGDHAGLGVEMADLVLLLDEDWSGRGELLLRSLTSRCMVRQGSQKKALCRFMKFVASRSCEESFLRNSKSLQLDQEAQERRVERMWPCPFNSYGVTTWSDKLTSVSFPKIEEAWSCEASTGYVCCFPATNIVRFRNEHLSDVLLTDKPLLPLLVPSQLCFLPDADGTTASVKVDIGIIASLLRSEETAGAQILLRSSSSRSAKVMASLNSILPHHALELPRKIIGRRDLLVLPTRLHLCRVSYVASTEQLGSDLGTSPLSAPPALSNTERSARLIEGENSNNWLSDHEPGEPDEVVKSLLFYSQSDFTAHCKPSSLFQIKARRMNVYSQMFSSVMDSYSLATEKTESEALLYCPPLFPGILGCTEQAHIDVESIRSSRKRMVESHAVAPSKKSRVDGAAVDETTEALGKGSFNDSVVTDDLATHNDAASVLFDLADDYGMAGIGAVPLPRDSALLASWEREELSSFYTSEDVTHWTRRLPPCDEEERQGAFVHGQHRGGNFSQMMLFVSRKRARGVSNVSPYAAITSSGGLSSLSQWSGSPVAVQMQTINTSFSDINGKKMKNIASAPKEHGVSAFSRLGSTNQAAPTLVTSAPVPKSKDINRGRLLVASRSSGRGNTLFEAPCYRTATALVRNRVADKIDRFCWHSAKAFDSGPGLPLILRQLHSSNEYQDQTTDPTLWTSVVKRLKTRDSQTGDESIGVALAQRVALRRAMNSPCRVDFGPFQCGFLAQPSGAIATAPPRHHQGISLPMGVKINQREQTNAEWTEELDELLQGAVARFGMNWILISSTLSGFRQPISSESSISVRKASRSCRERWQFMLRSQPSLAKESLSSDKPAEDDCMTERVELEKSAALKVGAACFDIEFLVPASTGSPAETEPKQPVVDVVSSEVAHKRSLLRFQAAKALKYHTLPIGDVPPAVPVHPSHAQTVQTATAVIAGFSSSGRTEMWPLQLLDGIDRHRAAQNPPTPAGATTKATGASSRSHSNDRTHPSSSSKRAASIPGALSGSSPRAVSSSSANKRTPNKTSNEAPPAAAASFSPPSPSKTTTIASSSSAPGTKPAPKVFSSGEKDQPDEKHNRT